MPANVAILPLPAETRKIRLFPLSAMSMSLLEAKASAEIWLTGAPVAGPPSPGSTGAAAGLAGVLLTRGPDAVLAKGSTIEMVLDRPLVFNATEVNFTTMANSGNFSDGAGPQPANKTGLAGPRRLPF